MYKVDGCVCSCCERYLKTFKGIKQSYFNLLREIVPAKKVKEFGRGVIEEALFYIKLGGL